MQTSSSTARLPSKTVEIHIRRRKDPDSSPYWEKFEIPYRPNLNVISCLMEIQKNPVNMEGIRTTPPVWQMNCLEQVCGLCTMIINGRARQSCSALIDNLQQPIKLERIAKFPDVRDPVVDRSSMLDLRKRVHDRIELDGSYDLEPGPRTDHQEVHDTYAYPRSMTSRCCLEACPQYEGNQD